MWFPEWESTDWTGSFKCLYQKEGKGRRVVTSKMQLEKTLYSQRYASGGSNYQEDDFENVLFMMASGGPGEERSQLKIAVTN